MNENEYENAAVTPPPAAPIAEMNGHGSDARPALTGMQVRPLPPDPVTGAIFLEAGPDAVAFFKDMAWFEDESWTGRWFPFMGKYIAILNKTHIDTDDDLTVLRDRVARERGVDAQRVLIEYIPPDILSEG